MSVAAPFKLGILGSGTGSNFAAIADACARGEIPAQVEVVVSDVEDAGILNLARERQLPARYIAPGRFRTKLDETAEQAYLETMKAFDVDLVVLAGFMRILKGAFLQAFENRVVNIHPSLLPAFPGMASWKQALDHGVKVAGCTVHFVDQGVDSGPIIAQEPVVVMEEDTPESLHQRIHAAEHRLYPRCIGMIARGDVQIQGRLVRIRS